MPAEILLGVVTAVHGLKGEVRVKTFAESPERLGDYGALLTPDGRKLEIASLRVTKADCAVVRFKGIEDRKGAEQLRNVRLLVGRTALPAIDEDEFYHADLIGLRAQDSEGRVIGIIRAIHNFGAGDVIELDRHGGGSLLLPFNREFVPKIDLENKSVTIAEPEDTEAREQRGIE
jgi:16S rRNA processing protein RimM